MTAKDRETSFPDDGDGDEAARLRLVTDAAPLLISYVDAGLHYRVANRAYADWFGRPQADVVGRHVREVIGEEAFRTVEPYLRTALGGARVSYETRMPYATGGPRYVHTDIVPDVAPDGRVRGFVGVIADISDRRRAEDGREAALTALAAAGAELRYVTTHARCLLWHGTVRDSGRPLHLAWDTHVPDLEAAQAFCRLDLLPGERYTDAWYRHRLPEGKELTDGMIRPALLAGERALTAEFGCVTADGAVRWFSERVYAEPLPPEEADGRPGWRVVGVAVDVTDRRAAEQGREAALRELAGRERELAALIGNSPDIISRFTPDLRCAFTSPAVERQTGLPPAFFVGKTHAEMGAPPEMWTVADASLRRVFATGLADQITFRLPGPDGRLRDYEATGVPLFGADGVTVESVMTVSRDVTDRRRAEDDREAALARVAESALRERALLRDVVYSVSEGRFRLCDRPADLPAPLDPVEHGGPAALTDATLGAFRHHIRAAAQARGFSDERRFDLETAVGEAGMNAARHGGGGTGEVRASADGATIQVWVRDGGEGIVFDRIHWAIRRGNSSAGTLGHGFWLMMQTADRLYLLTGPEGTTVVLEQDRVAPLPAWLQEASGGVALPV
jgi:PAS domain S-box-containing protein